MNLADLSDAELIALWRRQVPTDDGDDADQAAIADELERRNLDV